VLPEKRLGSLDLNLEVVRHFFFPFVIEEFDFCKDSSYILIVLKSGHSPYLVCLARVNRERVKRMLLLNRERVKRILTKYCSHVKTNKKCVVKTCWMIRIL
jgi:hypothetical protein